MRSKVAAATALVATAGMAEAGGLDRNYTPDDVIFERGNYAELGFAHVTPSLTGRDVLGNSIENVGEKFNFSSAAIKMDLSGPFSFALIYDQPYGSDVQYGGDPATTMLGGTMATADSHALTALFKYQANERLSFYGGPRWLKMDGEVTLSGLSSGPLNGYNVKLGSDSGVGFVVGAAYEIPDIAFRAALTYHSAIDLELPATQTFPGAPSVSFGTVDTEMPQSVKLALQSGIARNTLLFGSVRWSEWSAFTLDPPALGPGANVPNIATLDDVITWELGLGYKFSEKFSGRVAISYEDGNSSNLVSPLAPTNRRTDIAVGGKYQISDNVALSAGVRYTMFADTNVQAGPAGVVASFPDNDSLGVGMRLGISF